MQDRHLRSSDLIPLHRINQWPVVIVGVGAIGSHLAEILVKMGIQRLTLIDPDVVESVNLGVQGFWETDLGRPKVEAVTDKLQKINQDVEVEVIRGEVDPCQIGMGSVVFSCVDSMRVREALFQEFKREELWTAILDGRMAAETFQVLIVSSDSPESFRAYEQTLFSDEDAYQAPCTARATVYCATIAAALLASEFRKMAIGWPWEPAYMMSIPTMDVIRNLKFRSESGTL